MKKIKVFALGALILTVLTGCKPETPEELVSIAVKSGLKHDYQAGESVDLKTVEVDATFENSTKVIKGKDLTFNPTKLDTEVLGEGELTITYLTKSVVWDYFVSDTYEIDNLSAPKFVSDYYANISEKTNKRNEFMDREQGYHVGADNEFVFFPQVNAYNYRGDEVVLDELMMEVTLEEKTTLGGYTLLSGSALDQVVTINNLKGRYQFHAPALDKEYRLTVRPAGEEYADDDVYETSFEFKVVAGFNVYTQDDLSHFDNVGTPWSAYRTSHNLEAKNINGLIFHNDLKLEAANLPDGFFYKQGDEDLKTSDSDYERTLDSLRDSISLYQRDIRPSETFTLNGNYFNLSYVDLPVVTRDSGKITGEGLVVSHASIFQAGVTSKYTDNPTEQGQFIMKNLSVTGNANRSEVGVKSGGAIFNKISSVKAHIYNTIVTQSFTAHFPKYHSTETIVEKSRGYDSFSSLFYSWGAPNFIIKDSEFIGAGGPVIITDHVDGNKTTAEGGHVAHTHVINSVLESYVSGNENWFQLVGASAVAPLIAELGQKLLPAYGTNTIGKNVEINGKDVFHFNLISILKAGAVAGPTSTPIRGSFTIDDGVKLDFEGPFMQAAAPFPVSAPRFQSSGGQVALYDGTKLLGADGSPVAPYAMTQTNYFTGDYMNMYYNIGGGSTGFMGLVFGLATPTI